MQFLHLLASLPTLAPHFPLFTQLNSDSGRMALAQVARACLLVSVLFTRQQSLAQFNILDHRMQTFSVEEGLSQSSIWCVMQDSQGFMWFGTADGLNRFDGYTFKVYRHDARDSTSLRSNTVWSLLEDRRGTIWVGTAQGLHRFDRRTESFAYIPEDSSYRSTHLNTFIYSLVEGRDGNIWVTSSERVTVLNPSTGDVREYRASDFGRKNERLALRAHSVDDAGDVWLTCSNQLIRFEYSTKRFLEMSFPESMSVASPTLYVDKSGLVWMGNAASAAGLHAFDRRNNSWRRWGHDPRIPTSISSDFVRTICEDDAGKLWVGTTSGGLHVFDAERDEFTRVVPQSSTNTFYDKVSSIYRDRSGLIWVGYDGAGIVKINPQRNKFKHILLPPSRKKDTGDNFFKALMVDRDNRVWLGMYNQGVAVLDRETGNVKRLYDEFSGPGEGVNSVFALFEDSRGFVWVGTMKGLYRSDASTKRFRMYDLRGITRDDTRGRIITAFCEDSSGDVWIGSATSVLRYDRKRDVVETVLTLDRIDTSYVAPGVLCFAADGNGIWCGSLGIGLLRFSTEGQLVKQYKFHPRNANSISHNSVKTICVDPDGILWIGTEDGLNRFDPIKESWRRYGSADGLPNDFIYAVLMDRHRNLWISTNRGLSRMAAADPENPRFRNYAVHDGLQSSEFNTNTFFQTPEGEMFFGGVNGFNAFFPDSVKDNPVPPKVVLTRFKKFDQPAQLDEDISVAEDVRLSYDESVFSFEFAGLEFTNPQENLYAYMMEGFDKGWVFSGKRREARYTNLDPGEYVFRVKGSNSDGVWSESGTSIRVTIIPPFWRTGWFIGLMAVVGVGTFGGAVRFISTQKLKKRIRQLEREKEIQDERLRTRERIARDLHDDLASTVGSAGFFIESVKNQMKGTTSQAKEFLDKTSSLLTEAEEAMSDIVWSVSPKHDTLESLLARIRLTSADLCRANQIKYEVVLAENVEGFTLAEDVRRNIYLIFKEALSNAVRHSGASIIKIGFTATEGYYELTIADNGKGMPLPEASSTPSKRGHGLRNMAKRAEEVHAELFFEQANPSGTIVRLKGSLPAQRAG